MGYKRTPKNYRGNLSPSKKIADLLPGFLERFDDNKNLEKEEVFKAWYDIIGENLRAFTRPVRLEHGTLQVVVKSQTLYSLLCTHEKARLLTELQKRFSKKKIKNIHFRIG